MNKDIAREISADDQP
jgi:hypothetical protein